jgi:hypothetical protein
MSPGTTRCPRGFMVSSPKPLVWLSQVLWILGYPDRAWRVAQDGLGHAGPQGALDLVAMFQVCVTQVLRREFQAAHELADEAVELANKHALLQWLLYARLCAIGSGSRSRAVMKRLCGSQTA